MTAKHDGLKVVVGIRPENILETGVEGRGETAPIEAEVEIAEPLATR